jgi:MoxR-like ATPase
MSQNSNPYAITAKQAMTLVKDVLKARLVPMIHSSPGMGKSAIMKQIAETLGLKLIDVRLSTYDPVDLNGFPVKHADGKKAGYIPMDTFPLENDKLPPTGRMIPDPNDKTNQIPELYRGWLLFFDELTTASPAIQAAA